jgi:hypothetical protein
MQKSTENAHRFICLPLLDEKLAFRENESVEAEIVLEVLQQAKDFAASSSSSKTCEIRKLNSRGFSPRPPLFDEVSAKFALSARRIPTAVISVF